MEIFSASRDPTVTLDRSFLPLRSHYSSQNNLRNLQETRGKCTGKNFFLQFISGAPAARFFF